MAKRKILLDTDIGTDPDDSLCLTYLLRQSECELLGVTTVGPGVETRAQLAEIFTRHHDAGEIPIAAGAGTPYFPNQYWGHHRLGQRGVLERRPIETEYIPGRAPALMREVIRAHPGEVTLVAVGPLTNIGLLAAADPETASMVKELVLMGGFFNYQPDTPRTDCNIMLDPVSAGAVFHRRWPDVRVVSLDTTRGKGITLAEMEEHLDPDEFAPLFDFARIGLKPDGEPKGMGVHDPLTAATLFAPDLVRFERGRVGIKLSDHDLSRGHALEGDNVTGWTTFEANAEGPHGLARERDGDELKEAFHAHLFEVLGR